MKADGPAGEGLGSWWDQYAAIGEYLPVVQKCFEGNRSLACVSEASPSGWLNTRDSFLRYI